MLNVKCDLLINDKSKIGNEILAYLVDNPKAQDTLEGIVEWWLLERAIKFQELQVKKALAELVAKGLVIEQKGNNSNIHYRVNQGRLEEIKKLVKLMSGWILRVKDSAKIIRHYANSFKVGNIIIYFRENNHDFKFDFRQGNPENDQAELLRIYWKASYTRSL